VPHQARASVSLHLNNLVGLAAVQVVNEYHDAWFAFCLVSITPLLLLQLPWLPWLLWLLWLLQLLGLLRLLQLL
jgi:hypothetical protein